MKTTTKTKWALRVHTMGRHPVLATKNGKPRLYSTANQAWDARKALRWGFLVTKVEPVRVKVESH